MDQLPEDRINAIPVKTEHLKSDAIKYPAPYPEENKVSIHQEIWDGLVARYGEEKVKQYYRVIDNG